MRRRSARAAGLAPLFLAGLFLAGCGGGEPEAAPPDEADPASVDESAAVLEAVETVLEAITTADGELARTVVLPYAHIASVTEGGLRVLSGEEFSSGISDPEQHFVERMWDPVVRVDGPVATVWATYDFYVDGEFSHCGVDTFQLARVGGDWKVVSLVYNTRQPPDCGLHPGGPPA